MSLFKSYTSENAPDSSKPLIEESIKTYGFLPNLHAVLAESPAAYEAYARTFEIFEKRSSLSPLEQQVVFMTANYENNCHYCVPGHTMLMTMQNMPQDIIEGLRKGTVLSDKKLEALRTYTRQLIEKRGHLDTQEIEELLNAGFTRQQALDVLVGLSSKLISNFTNAIAQTEVDEPVKAFAWTHPSER